MSLIVDRAMKVLAIFVILTLADAKPQLPQQTYLPPPPSQSGVRGAASENHLLQQFAQQPRQTFYLPPAVQNQQFAPSNQQQFLTQQPIQLQVPIPNNGVEEQKIYVQLPPQQYPQQQPQYRYPPRKHYKIILVRSPPQPTPPPAPVLPEIEEQTLVYVLVKKQDSPSAAELAQLQQQQQQSIKLNKPEVYFIKYKANEERADDSLPAVASEAIEKSIEQQLNNNVGGAYTYDAARKREAKNLNQNEGDKELNQKQ